MPIDFTEVVVEPALHRSAINVRRKPQRSRPRRTSADAVGINRHLLRIEMNSAFALGLPQPVQKYAHLGERLTLSRLHLGARPIDPIDLWPGRSQRAKIF